MPCFMLYERSINEMTLKNIVTIDITLYIWYFVIRRCNHRDYIKERNA